jgi:hypothetical protein
LPTRGDASATTAPSIHRHNLPAPVTAFIGREREIGRWHGCLAGLACSPLPGPAAAGRPGWR